MRKQLRTYVRSAVTLIGLAAIALGSSLPWVRPNPTSTGERDAVPDILLPKMDAGIDGYSILLLTVVAVAVAVLALDRGDRTSALLLLLLGVGTVGIVTHYVLTTALVGFDGTFVPATGWYLTLLGGVLLGGVGVSELVVSRTGSATNEE